MGLELEHEVGDIDEKEHDGGSTGDNEKTRSATLLDDTRLASLQEGVKDVIINTLGHEIGGRDDERCVGRQNQVKKNLRNQMSHSLMHASVMREEAFCAAVTWKLLSGYFKPPAKKEHPKTRSKLERMEPSSCVICYG